MLFFFAKTDLQEYLFIFEIPYAVFKFADYRQARLRFGA